jgi:hypothetical protein
MGKDRAWGSTSGLLVSGPPAIGAPLLHDDGGIIRIMIGDLPQVVGPDLGEPARYLSAIADSSPQVTTARL